MQVLALSVDDASDRHRPPGAATGCALYLRRNRSLPGRIRDDILRDLGHVAEASGVGLDDLFHGAVPVESQALNHWCWHTCERDSLATSMAATNLAIEGATGEWSAMVCESGVYEQSLAPEVRKKGMRWLKMHAHYDDTHPWEALEIVCSLIGRVAEPAYVTMLGRCIANSYAYMALSLDRCLLAPLQKRH